MRRAANFFRFEDIKEREAFLLPALLDFLVHGGGIVLADSFRYLQHFYGPW